MNHETKATDVTDKLDCDLIFYQNCFLLFIPGSNKQCYIEEPEV